MKKRESTFKIDDNTFTVTFTLDGLDVLGPNDSLALLTLDAVSYDMIGFVLRNAVIVLADLLGWVLGIAKHRVREMDTRLHILFWPRCDCRCMATSRAALASGGTRITSPFAPRTPIGHALLTPGSSSSVP